MPAIDLDTLQVFIHAGQNAATTVGLVPGVAITHRNVLNAFDTEEIDVALWNEGNDSGFRSLPTLMLIECKN